MTARSGDALSHVCFQVRQSGVSMEIGAPEFCEAMAPRARRDFAGAGK
jgi:hypothetical protein